MLVSRSTKILNDYAAELRGTYGVKATVLTHDLSVPGSADGLYDECKKLKLDIDILVNDAGFSVKTEEEWTDFARVESMFELLAVTPPNLCARFARDMKIRGRGFVVNVASASGFFPVGMMRTYGAIKTFLLRYTKLLALELKDSGVKVLCVAPGGVRSHFFDANSLEVPERFDWILKVFLMSASRVAKNSVKSMLRGRRLIIPGVLTKFYTAFTFILPGRWVYGFYNLIEKFRILVSRKPDKPTEAK